MAVLFGVLILMAGVLAYLFFITVLRAWVLTKLWAWFLVPIFGWQPLPLIGALGIALIVAYLCKDPNFNAGNPDWTKEQKIGYGVMMPVLIPLSTLFVAWLYLQFAGPVPPRIEEQPVVPVAITQTVSPVSPVVPVEAVEAVEAP